MPISITVPDNLVGTIAGALRQRQEALVREAASITDYAEGRVARDPEDEFATLMDGSTPDADADDMARLQADWADAERLCNQLAGRASIGAGLDSRWQSAIRSDLAARPWYRAPG